MKLYLISVSIILLGAVVLAIGVFFFLQFGLMEEEESAVRPVLQPASSTQNTNTVNPDVSDVNSQPQTDTVSETVPEEGIPLSSLPLSESQRTSIEKVGINVDTFIITPTMVECGEGRLGVERMQEIIGGAAPSFIESLALTTCLKE